LEVSAIGPGSKVLTPRSASVEPMPVNSEIAGELEHALSELLSWRFGDWDKHHTGYTDWRKTWTKEQFQKLLAEYPEPLPDAD